MPWLELTVVLVSGAAFGVLFQIPPRYLWASALLGVLAFYASKVPASLGLHAAHASFLAATLVGVCANALARRLGRPSQVFLIPGVILLVPGSVGYRALQSLLAGEQATGIALALSTGLTAGGIVSGVLLASLMLPSRKIL